MGNLRTMSQDERHLDKQIAEKYFDMGWIEEGKGDGELHGWNWHPCDISYPPYTSYYYGVVPRYSADPAAATLFEQKLEEYGCMEEYARALAVLGTSTGAATPEQRCRAAVEIHPFYEARVKAAVEASSRESSRVYNEGRERAEQFVAGIRERLVRLAELRPFRFVATRRAEAEAYLRRLTEFEGFDDGGIYWAARAIRGNLTHVYTAFLRQMGHARGALFEGSAADADELLDYKPAAEEILRRCGVPSFLDEHSLVFMLHQGYTFCYFQTDYKILYDAPVFQYTECDPAPRPIAPGFAELLDAELTLMEETNRTEREQGGYLLTVEHGFARRTYPALSDAPRPLDTEDDLI